MSPRKKSSTSKTTEKRTVKEPAEVLSSTQKILQKRDAEFPMTMKLNVTGRRFRKLTHEEVHRSCNLKIKQIKKTRTPNYEIISQPRAVRAIEIGLGIQKPGYNIYVAGVQGTGKNSVIRTFLKKIALNQKKPGDWIYIYNFKNPESPCAIEMQTGMAKKFKKKMESLIEQVVEELNDAFQSEEYENNVNSTVNANNERKTKLFNELEKIAKKRNFGVKSTRMGIVTVPIIKGKPLSEKDYSDLTDAQKTKIETERNLLEPEILDFARKVRTLESDTKEKLDALQEKLGTYVLNQKFSSLMKEYDGQKEIISYLEEVKKHILENLENFLQDDEEGVAGGAEGEEVQLTAIAHKKGDPYLSYRVNVFVDNTEVKGAPIIFENNPTFYNLFGKIEKNIEYGVYTTDFKMIKAGSIARANGGYLVLNILDMLKIPHVWDTLKRVMKNQQIYIEDLGEQYSILATSGLRPEPIPLNVKIILIGSDWMYRMLYEHDEDFRKIFKIKADFDYEMHRSEKTIEDYVTFISTRSMVEKLLPFDESAVSAIVEFGSRVVDDQDKLTTCFSLIKDITIEADFMARERKSKTITREDVEKTVDERYYRSNSAYDHIVEMLQRKDILITTNARRIGEINGLAVYSTGDMSFGVPSRITCRTYKGRTGILNVEREAALSGKIHNKGVSILTSWINGTFGRKHPVNISATICFEQNYSGIDGDSATLAEMCLILSTVGDIPLDQSVAVTGSVNQFGEVQPVGGVNEKIEGFFKACEIQGLTGRQGCIIPVQNIKHLMLKKEVTKSIAEGNFHIWAVARIEEAFELLTGHEAGNYNSKTHTFSKGSAFAHIAKQLRPQKESANKKEKNSSKTATKKKAPAKKKTVKKKKK